jgi:Protein of unknown function (DUF732)
MTMRVITKAVSAVTLAAGLSIAGLAGAGTASADEATYIARLIEGNFSDLGDALDWGYRICDDWWAGVRPETIINYIFVETDESITYDHARYIFDAAVQELC